MAPSEDNLAAKYQTTTEEIQRAPSLLAFISAQKQLMLGTLSAAFSHLAADLLQSYVEEGILVRPGLPYSREALKNTIKNGPRASACTLEMLCFILE